MDNNVVMALTDHLAGAGLATLRFNFRGVGASTGSHHGTKGESEDARAAARYLMTETGRSTTALAGYSFGAAVILGFASEDFASCLVAVAPPLAMMAGGLPEQPGRPVLLIAGDADPYCRSGDLDQLYRRLNTGSKVIVLSGADHFLMGREDEIGQAAAAFLTD